MIVKKTILTCIAIIVIGSMLIGTILLGIKLLNITKPQPYKHVDPIMPNPTVQRAMTELKENDLFCTKKEVVKDCENTSLIVVSGNKRSEYY